MPSIPVRAESQSCSATPVIDEASLRIAVAAFLDPSDTCDLISLGGSFDISARIDIFGGEIDFPQSVDKPLTIDGNGFVLTAQRTDEIAPTGFIVSLNGDNAPHTLAIRNLGMSGFGGLGALAVIKGSTTIDRSRFSDNSYHAPDETIAALESATAGAVNALGPLTIENSEFVDNSGSTGGAVTNGSNEQTTISGSTFARNDASAISGAIYTVGDLATINSTISENSANQHAAISSEGDVTIDFCTIVDNSSEVGAAIALGVDTQLTVRYSIIFGNTETDISASGTPVIEYSYLTSPVSVTVDFVPFVVDPPDTNLYGDDPMLEVLGQYGGFTLPGGSTIRTRPPKAGSPVIDKIELVSTSSIEELNDQRGSGFERLFNGLADMGAVEYRPKPQRPSFRFNFSLPDDSQESELPSTR